MHVLVLNLATTYLFKKEIVCISWFTLIYQSCQVAEAEIAQIICKPFTVCSEDRTFTDTLHFHESSKVNKTL